MYLPGVTAVVGVVAVVIGVVLGWFDGLAFDGCTFERKKMYSIIHVTQVLILKVTHVCQTVG